MKRSAVVLALLGSGLVGCVGVLEGDGELASNSDALWFSKAPGYVALGDSIDFGVGASPGNGYVNQFRTWLEQEHYGHAIDHLNLSVVGADSKAILDGQTKQALVFNAKHLLEDKVITVGSGGNDLLNFIKSPEFTPCATGDQAGCQQNLGAVIAKYAENLDKTMARLRLLADENHAVLIARTQYTGFVQPSCSVNGAIDKDGNVFLTPQQVRALIPLSFLALEGSNQDPSVRNDPFPGLNDVIRDKADKYGAATVELMRPFLAAIQSGQALIIRDCVHPNDAGHGLIADLTIEAFQSEQAE